jgi:hypothetical protein
VAVSPGSFLIFCFVVADIYRVSVIGYAFEDGRRRSMPEPSMTTKTLGPDLPMTQSGGKGRYYAGYSP